MPTRGSLTLAHQTGTDCLRFGRMLLNGGQLDGVRVISAEAVGGITRDQIAA